VFKGARIPHRARQDVRPQLAAFFEHADRNLPALFRRQLLQPDRGRQAGRTAADDDDVIFHRFARTVLFDEVVGLGHVS
jgi:hypothetical protein